MPAPSPKIIAHDSPMNVCWKNTSNIHIEQFQEDVLQDLNQVPKRLRSKYFYDSIGDNLFQEIMASPEYYLTKCEMEIFKTRTAQLALSLNDSFSAFDLLEMGAGDASKSSYLIKHFMSMKLDFTYMPIDISTSIIEQLLYALPGEIPGLKLKGFNGEYLNMLERANQESARNKVILLLGANISNEMPENALAFCRNIRSLLKVGDKILIGFDLIKDPYIILAAYNDGAGFTREFNLNLLRRINKELNGNFDPQQFTHYPTYDPATGACKSYLVSKISQEVILSGRLFHFHKDEFIFMEISQKYNISEIENIARSSGFEIVNHFFDRKNWFVDTVWECI